MTSLWEEHLLWCKGFINRDDFYSEESGLCFPGGCAVYVFDLDLKWKGPSAFTTPTWTPVFVFLAHCVFGFFVLFFFSFLHFIKLVPTDTLIGSNVWNPLIQHRRTCCTSGQNRLCFGLKNRCFSMNISVLMGSFWCFIPPATFARKWLSSCYTMNKLWPFNLNFIYIVSFTIKTVSRAFKETQSLTLKHNYNFGFQVSATSDICSVKILYISSIPT